MGKGSLAIISGVAWIVYATSEIIKNIIEQSLHVRLITAGVNYADSDWILSFASSQKILLIVAIVSFILYLISIAWDYHSISLKKHEK